MKHSFVSIAAVALVLSSCTGTVNTNLNPVRSIENSNVSSSSSNQNTTVESNSNITPSTLNQSTNVRALSITAGATITSPLNLTGEAKGWFFEGSFPMRIEDAKGKILYEGAVPATENWMQEGFVPFKTRAFFTAPTADTGTIILMNDNPSGLPENMEQYSIPVKFGITEITQVQLFFQSSVGLPACGMVTAVQRAVPRVPEIGTRALEELLGGPSSDTEKGVLTTIPNGTTLQRLTIVGGQAEVHLISSATSLNDCQKTTMKAQIEQTLKQFPTVRNVEIRVNDQLF